MIKKYKVVIVGYGKRGKNHLKHFQKNKHFEVVGVCDFNGSKLSDHLVEGIATDTQVKRLISRVSYDVFCLCTPPSMRYEMIKLGMKPGVKLLAIEKPIALSSKEGLRIKRIIDGQGIKTVICHQHRYGKHYKRVKEIIRNKEIGKVHTIYATATGWAMHMLPHLLNYMMWYNNDIKAEWVIAQTSGKKMLIDNHPSPDYIVGFIQFANNVHGIVECGAGAPDVPEVDYWWHKCSIRLMGTEGFAEVLTGAGWRSANKNGFQYGPGQMNYDLDMPQYIQDIADWLKNPKKIHPCNFECAYHSFEIMMALWRSAINGGQIALPLRKGKEEVNVLKEKMPWKKVRLSSDINAKYYL